MRANSVYVGCFDSRPMMCPVSPRIEHCFPFVLEPAVHVKFPTDMFFLKNCISKSIYIYIFIFIHHGNDDDDDGDDVTMMVMM